MRKFYLICFLIIAGTALGTYYWFPAIWSAVITVPLMLIGIIDIIQPAQTIRRNFPVIGRMRYWAEWMRPKIYQYFIESDTDGAPFSRINRNVIYQRAKKVTDTIPFGTQLNVYETGYEWLNHSITPLSHHDVNHHPRVKVGGPECKIPYEASIYNISAMSFGSLSRNAILALNNGAKLGASRTIRAKAA